MALDRVTITGADDSVTVNSLVGLSSRYPFVEWGILASASQEGSSRFPSRAWLRELLYHPNRDRLKLSLHLCGRWLRGLLIGERPPIGRIAAMCQRMQLNFHGEEQVVADGFAEALDAMGPREIIFQIDGRQGYDIMCHVFNNGPQAFDVVPLFDMSHGAGRLPTEWPKPYNPDSYHGYAGGLGPDNLGEQIPRIAAAAGDVRHWIDMETKVRSAADRVFDLRKVERCLEIAAPFVVA